MQKLRAELDAARAARAEATDPGAVAGLDAVIVTLAWAIDDVGNAPSEIAAAYRAPEKPKPAPKAPAKKRGK